MKLYFFNLVAIAALLFSPLETFAGPKGGGGKGGGSGSGDGLGGGVGGGRVNDGNPVPEIQDNDSSADFIAARIAADTGWPAEEMVPYGRRLAKTLSQLSAKEQAEVFYGSN